MLSPGTWSKGIRKVAKYFDLGLSAGDYYAEDGKVAGQWFGTRTGALDLEGPVERDAFLAVLEGRHPATGEFLSERQKEDRRSHKDYVFSAPKSVSVIHALADPMLRAKIEEAHLEAVAVALKQMERHAGARDRRSGAKKTDVLVTGNIIVGVFPHNTARPTPNETPDPQLHCHAVLANLTQDQDGRWLALEDSVILAHQMEISAAYDAYMAAACSRLGFHVEADGRSWRLAEVDPRAEKLFSKRHRQIATAAKAKSDEIEAKTGNRPSPEAVKEIVAHEAREKKLEHLSSAELLIDWRRQLREAGIREDGLMVELASCSKRVSKPAKSARQAVAQAIVHLTEREAVITEQQAIAASIRFSLGSGLSPDAMRYEVDRLVNAKVLLRSGQKITTAEALYEEQRLVAQAKAGREKVHSLVGPDYFPNPRLSAEQAKAARRILSSSDRTTLLRGPAGTGKSTLLVEVVSAAEKAGLQVIICAPTGRQARGLEADGFLQPQTLSRILARPIPRGAFVICDEAGQAGIFDLLRLQSATEAAGGRLLLSGDARQHGSVARGDALRQIEKDSGVTMAELSSIRRQDASRGRDDVERKYISEFKEAAMLASQGKTRESFVLMEKLGSIHQVHDPLGEAARLGQEKSRDGSTLVVAQTRIAVTRLNQDIRSARVAAGQVSRAGVKVSVFIPLDSTLAERRDVASYKIGTLVSWTQKHGEMARGSIAQVIDRDERKGQLLVRGEDGRTRRVGMTQAQKWQIVETTEIEIASGDQIALGQNASIGRKQSVSNGEIVTVKYLDKDGSIVLTDGRTLPRNYRHFLHGYASTSFGGQGRTVEHVVIADAGSRAATSARQWYVDLTRGRRSATVLTADKGALSASICRSGDSLLASDQSWERQPTARERLIVAGKLARPVVDLAVTALAKLGLSPLMTRLQRNAKASSEGFVSSKLRDILKLRSHRRIEHHLPDVVHLPAKPLIFRSPDRRQARDYREMI